MSRSPDLNRIRIKSLSKINVWMVMNGGQGEIRTRDFCLAKAAIYRADLLAHLNPVRPPNPDLHINLCSASDGRPRTLLSYPRNPSRVHEAPEPVRREPASDGGVERQRLLRRRLRGEEPPGHRAGEARGGVHRLHGHLPQPPPRYRHQAHGPLRGHAGRLLPRPHRPPVQADGVEVQLQARGAVLR